MSSSNISPPPLKRRRLSPSHEETSDKVSIPSETALEEPLDPADLRIYSWNINGISPFLPAPTPSITSFFSPPKSNAPPAKPPLPEQPSLRACLRRWAWPQILALQEVKIASNDIKTQNAVRRIVNTSIDSDDEDDEDKALYDVHFCLPRDKYNATGFGGKVHGVCSLVRRDWQDVKIKTVHWDLEGRVLICEIAAHNLAVINVYAVNGTTYGYRDPTTGAVVGTRHDRKRAFHTFLSDEVRGYEDKGWQVVVVGDINISRTKDDSFPQLRMGEDHVRNRADFEGKFMVDLGMLDTFRLVNGMAKKYTYRPTNKPWGAGGDRVDMILATKGLRDFIHDADILDGSPDERGSSDHVPLCVTMRMF